MTHNQNWQEYIQPRNPVMALLSGKNAPIVPVMPICQDVPSLPFQHHRGNSGPETTNGQGIFHARNAREG